MFTKQDLQKPPVLRDKNMSKRGYFGIGIWNYMHEVNIGTLFRSAYALGADFIYTIGRAYRKQSSDTVYSARHLPLMNYPSIDDFLAHLPKMARLISVEIAPNAFKLSTFVHPERAIYLLGSEGQTLPQRILEKSLVVQIPSSVCLNVSVCGSIVLYDRISKMENK